jgi:hypothetical protein
MQPHAPQDYPRCTDPTIVKDIIDWSLCIDCATTGALQLGGDPFVSVPSCTPYLYGRRRQRCGAVRWEALAESSTAACFAWDARFVLRLV